MCNSAKLEKIFTPVESILFITDYSIARTQEFNMYLALLKLLTSFLRLQCFTGGMSFRNNLQIIYTQQQEPKHTNKFGGDGKKHANA